MRGRRISREVARAGRTAARGAGLATILTIAAAELIASSDDRRLQLQQLCRQLTRLLGLRIEVIGPVPSSGLIVCNHLSYLDILVLSATTPAVFVAKREVRSWPVFGWFAGRTGTIFIARHRPAECRQAAEEIRTSLQAGAGVVLFPEGTSSGGEQVLPFKSSLLEPAIGTPVAAAALDYTLERGEGTPAEHVCYWKDMTLVPHLFGLLGRRRIRAVLAFDPAVVAQGDRKTLALQLHARVSALHSAARAAPAFRPR